MQLELGHHDVSTLTKSPDVQDQRVPKEVSADTVALLHFELLKQIITLALAGAGGALTLIQTLLDSSEARVLALAGVGALLLSALLALVVQEYMVERLGEQTRTMRTSFFVPKWLRAPRTPRVERAYFIGSLLSFSVGVAAVAVAASGLLELQ